MKIKHNKTKNTGLIYELLVKQIASDTLAGRKSPAISILKKYYTGNSFLVKEFRLYDFILRNKNVSASKAEVILGTITEVGRKLDQKSLRNQKYNLIKEIKENYDINEFFSIKVNNYKPLAALYCLLEAQNSTSLVNPSVLVENKITLLEHLGTGNHTESEVRESIIEEYSKYDKDLRLLSYKILLEKFNNKYVNLLPEQKDILREFITSVSSTNKLRSTVNSKLETIKEQITKLSKNVHEPVVKIKVLEIAKGITLLDNKTKVSEENLVLLMQYYELINELKVDE